MGVIIKGLIIVEYKLYSVSKTRKVVLRRLLT